MSYASRIIDDIFGGARKMAEALTVHELNRVYPATTVQSWKDAGLIPSKHHGWILLRGRELKKKLSAEDFFDIPNTKPKRARAS